MSDIEKFKPTKSDVKIIDKLKENQGRLSCKDLSLLTGIGRCTVGAAVNYFLVFGLVSRDGSSKTGAVLYKYNGLNLQKGGEN